MNMKDLMWLRKTGEARWVLVPRLIAALPLTVFGAFHLTGMTPLMEIMERAGIPFPGVNYILAPVLLVVSGLSLGFGYLARLGAFVAMITMLVASYSKIVIEDWPGPMEPPLALPIVVLLASVAVLVSGAGKWSADLRAWKGE